MNAVIMSFDPNKKQRYFARETAMKCMRAVESDSVKSARISCTMPVKERQKLVRELCIGRNKTECAWQAMRVKPLSKLCREKNKIECTKYESLKPSSKLCIGRNKTECAWQQVHHMNCCAEGLALQCLSFQLY